MNIICDKKERKPWLSQEKCIEKVSDRFNMKDINMVGTPLASHFKLSVYFFPCDGKENEEMSDPGGYWWSPTYSNWLLLSIFVQHVLLYFFVIMGSTLLGLSKSLHIFQVHTRGYPPNPIGLFCIFSCQHIFLYF